jgi:hypothetical protein
MCSQRLLAGDRGTGASDFRKGRYSEVNPVERGNLEEEGAELMYVTRFEGKLLAPAFKDADQRTRDDYRRMSRAIVELVLERCGSTGDECGRAVLPGQGGESCPPHGKPEGESGLQHDEVDEYLDPDDVVAGGEGVPF